MVTKTIELDKAPLKTPLAVAIALAPLGLGKPTPNHGQTTVAIGADTITLYEKKIDPNCSLWYNQDLATVLEYNGSSGTLKRIKSALNKYQKEHHVNQS